MLINASNLKMRKMANTHEIEEKAVGYFCTRPKNFPEGRPFNCCESVLAALKDQVDEGAEILPKVGTGIGAGVSLNGLLCGCISSIAMLIGIRYGRTNPEQNPQPVWSMVDRYVAEFKNKFKYVNCRELTKLDLKTADGFKEYYAKVHDYACAERIRFAVKKGAEILQIT
jgi:C_GCAxxG_C_C family probable redox protein